MHARFAAGVLLCALSAPAVAADFPPVKASAPPPAFSWTGVSIGVEGGYAFADYSDLNFYDAFLFPEFDAFTYTGLGFSPDGWFAGFNVGADYQFANNVVVGVIADYSFADLKDGFSYERTWVADPQGPAIGTEFGELDAKIDQFATVRARLGYAFDNFLPYVTGGFAYAHSEISWDGTRGVVEQVPYAYSQSQDHYGWVVGGGAEYAFGAHWSAKFEYLYADFDPQTYGVTLELLENRQIDFSLQQVKFGVSLRM